MFKLAPFNFLLLGFSGIVLLVIASVNNACSQESAYKGNSSKIELHFPRQSVGKLRVVRNSEFTVDPIIDKSTFAEAQGTLQIPRQTKLKLILNENACKKGALLGFSEFPVGVIYGVDAGNLESFDDDALAQVCRLRGLRELSLLNTEITDAGLPLIRKQSSLEKLQLGETAITAKAIDTLRTLKSLVVLNLHFTNMRGADFVALKDLTKLRTLNVSNCQMDSDCLSKLAKIASLEALAICGNGAITDNSIVQLKALIHLKVLNIRDTSTTPACIAILKTLKLTSLEVSFPAKAVAQLKKSMPGVNIMSSGNPVLSPDLFAPLH